MTWVPVAALAVSITSMLLGAYLTITLHRMNVSLRKYERLEDTRERQVASLEAKVHETAVKLIDERFRAMTHDLNNHVGHFKLTLDSLANRLADGEQGLGKLVDVDHAMEIKTLNRMEQIKDYVRDTCASKADVREHEKNVASRLDRLGEKVQGLTIAVTAMGKNVEKHA